MTCTRAAARVPLGSAGSAVTPVATSTRCWCLVVLGAVACTAKVSPHTHLHHLTTPISPQLGTALVTPALT